jgi:hypothetical protein
MTISTILLSFSSQLLDAAVRIGDGVDDPIFRVLHLE